MDRLDPPKPPIYTEEGVDASLQTGDSKLLGGEMRIRSPWTRE